MSRGARRRLSREAVTTLYKQGCTTPRKLCARSGVSYKTARKYLTQMGLFVPWRRDPLPVRTPRVQVESGSEDGRPRITNDKLLAQLVAVHGPEPRYDIAPELLRTPKEAA